MPRLATRRLHRLLPLLTAAGIGGCDAPSALDTPTMPTGSFALEAVGVHPLPAVITATADVRQIVLAETLHIAPDGRGLRRYHLRSEFPLGGRAPEVSTDSIRVFLGILDGRLLANDDLWCLSDAFLSCGRQLVESDGDVLRVGARQYRRVLDAP